jgi:hypothetical protein
LDAGAEFSVNAPELATGDCSTGLEVIELEGEGVSSDDDDEEVVDALQLISATKKI